MSLWEFCSLGIALGTDSFSVSVGIGVNKIGWKRIIKLSLLFSILQVILLIIGFRFSSLLDFFLDGSFQWVSNGDITWIRQIFSSIGAGILIYMGGKMISSYFNPNRDTIVYVGRKGLILLAIGVSIDALTAGIGLGMLSQVDIKLGAIIVGLVIWLMSLGGLSAGRLLTRIVGRKMELVGGSILIFLAIHFLLSAF